MKAGPLAVGIVLLLAGLVVFSASNQFTVQEEHERVVRGQLLFYEEWNISASFKAASKSGYVNEIKMTAKNNPATHKIVGSNDDCMKSQKSVDVVSGFPFGIIF